MKILKPGLLVSLKTSLVGGVKYDRKDLAVSAADVNVEADAVDVAKWETIRTIDDKDEYDRAVKLRGKLRSLVAGVCSPSSFGLLCPQAREQELDDALKEATERADAWNKDAKISKVHVYVLKGKIAESDNAATAALVSEVKDLLAEMRTGIMAGDVAATRDACNRAKKLGAVLDGEAAGKVAAAIKEAREAAKQIVKALTAGEGAATVVSQIKFEALAEEQFAFLDVEEPVAVDGEEMSPVAAVAADVEPEPDAEEVAEPINGDDADATAAVDADALSYAAQADVE